MIEETIALRFRGDQTEPESIKKQSGRSGVDSASYLNRPNLLQTWRGSIPFVSKEAWKLNRVYATRILDSIVRLPLGKIEEKKGARCFSASALREAGTIPRLQCLQLPHFFWSGVNDSGAPLCGSSRNGVPVSW